MGIINVTPDSFYDGGKTMILRDVLAQADKMISEGATFLDIGGYSSRPGADEVSLDEELQRVIPAIENILNAFPKALISIDTFRSEVAKKAIEAGAAIVNDISAGNLDPQMMSTVAHLKVPYIMMHMRGNPATMQGLTNYSDVAQEIIYFFSEKIAEARSFGISDIIIDPGFGFAKTSAQNFELLGNLELFKSLEQPSLVGISRKSMIYKTLDQSAAEAINGTTALHAVALLKGASILRVHDVKEALECVKLLQQLKEG